MTPRRPRAITVARPAVPPAAGLLAFLLLLAAFVLSATPARAIDIERVVSPGGIEAWLVRDDKNPIISLQFAFDGGTELDPVQKQGLATMAMSLLDEGAGDLDSQAFQKKLEDNSIGLGFSAGRDGIFGSVTTLKETKGLAFDLLRMAITQPRFDTEAVERIRNQIMAGLKRSQADPNYWAGLAFAQATFPDHPYGKQARGTLETVPAITRDDLAAFPKARFGRDRLTVAAAGDITAAELATVLDQVFGALPAKTEPFSVPDVAPRGAGAVIAVNRPIPQTIMVMGTQGLKRDDPDWFAGVILNYVLGGGSFSSRLMEEVREKRGLTYGVSSSLQPFEHAALLVVGGSTANEKAGDAIKVIREVWAEVGRKGITAEELKNAQTYLTGSFPLTLTNTGSIAGILLQVQRDELGIDYLNRRNDLINKVTLDDVNRVAKKLLDPATLATVVVGQPTGVTPTATAFGEKG